MNGARDRSASCGCRFLLVKSNLTVPESRWWQVIACPDHPMNLGPMQLPAYVDGET